MIPQELDTIAEELIRLGKFFVSDIKFEEHVSPVFTGNSLGKSRGRVRWELFNAKSYIVKNVWVFYTDKLSGVISLAHEIGHLNTMSGEDIPRYIHNPFTQCGFEFNASRWALAFLKDKLSEYGYAFAIDLCNRWIDTYYADNGIAQVSQKHFQNEEVTA